MKSRKIVLSEVIIPRERNLTRSHNPLGKERLIYGFVNSKEKRDNA